MVDIYFLVIPHRSMYSCILGRTFASTLDAIASPVHLKRKHHNDYDESVIICANLSGAQRIHKGLQSDQNKDKENMMETNVASIIILLRDMAVKPSTCKMNNSNLIPVWEDS